MGLLSDMSRSGHQRVRDAKERVPEASLRAGVSRLTLCTEAAVNPVSTGSLTKRVSAPTRKRPATS